MKQTLQLRLGQHLTMTPQLQQAIRLLQLSTLELQTEIQEALDSNLMLEVDDGSDSSPSNGTETATAPDSEIQASNSQESDTTELNSAEKNNEIPDELPVDSNWDDIYETISTAPTSASSAAEHDFEISGSTEESLREHLHWQMELTPFSETDQIIAEIIIDAISDDGYLSQSIEDIHQAIPEELQAEVEFDEVEAVLHRIQNFDPPGIAARDLRESLILQLKQIDCELPWQQQATILVKDHFELLANRDYALIARRMKITEDELKDIIQLIQSLNPRPGSQITSEQAEYIVPDVVI